MKPLLIITCCLLIKYSAGQSTADCCDSPQKESEAIRVQSSAGQWIFSSPESGIIKAVFSPQHYERNENVSNAVILKMNSSKISVDIKKDTVISFSNGSIIRLQKGKPVFSFSGKEAASVQQTFEKGNFRGFQFDLKKDEKIFGGGERAIPLDRRGYRIDFYNRPNYGYGEGAENLNFSVPFLISSNGYGLFFDNPSKGYADIGKETSSILEAGFISGELNCYIIEGNNVAEIVKRFTDLTGTQDIPARWTFGALISRFGYRSEEQARDIVMEMQQQKFPMDAMVFDLFWFGDSIKGTLGNLEWVNSQKFPHPGKMISDFKEHGVKTILITEPYILQNTLTYQQSLPLQSVDSSHKPYVLQQFYFGHGGLLDLFRNDAQDWFWNQYQKQIKIGVAGWWGDLGEPETHPSDIYHNLSDLGYKRLFKADEVHNLFGQYWSKMLSDKYAATYPDVRLFHLNRSGFAGSQRYHAFPWTGDVGRNWSGLRAQLPVLLGMSICGIPYVHSDAGGFAGGEKDPELYTRWLQFAVFTPVFRPHGTAFGDLEANVKNIEPEPIYYPEPYKSIVRNYFNLRYALMPYNYTLAYEQEKDGKPLMRPMFYESTADSNLLKAGDQFFWGDEMMIAPVLEKDAVQRKIYFPNGTWYQWSSSNKFTGNQWVNVPVDITNIPVFVKAGSFIPMADSLMNMDQYSGSKLQVSYYYDSLPSAFTQYEDDGKTNGALQKGKYVLLTFSSSPKKSKQLIELKGSGGSYTGKPVTQAVVFSLYHLPAKPVKVLWKGKSIIADTSWDASGNLLRVPITFDGSTSQLKLYY